MAKEKGQFTQVADKVEKLITNRDFVTNYGECIELERSVIDNITCDITNMILDKDVKKSASGKYRTQKGKSLLYDLFGNFIFLHYGNILDVEIDTKYLFRFIYLATYTSYKDNKLMKTERTPLRERDLKDILKLPNKMELSRTLRALKDKDLIYVNDEFIYIKNKYVSKGKVKKRVSYL